VRPFLALALLLPASAFLAACDRHPLLGTWALPELEQAWEIENKGKLKVSFGYEDTTCTEGGQANAVAACHDQRKWAKAGTMTVEEGDVDAYQFVVWKVSANTLNGRLDSCRCVASPDIYYGAIENGDLLLFDSDQPTRSLIDRGSFQGTSD
jgi:hypothetical protein